MLTKEQYIDRVRKALERDEETTMSQEDYIAALEELAADLNGMLEAAEQEFAEE